MMILIWICLAICSSYSILRASAINVALHAQVAPTAGFIVGSVITTSGLQSSFQKLPGINKVQIFYPFEYSGLHDTLWDILIIEGWFHSINAVIHEVRKISPSVRVLFYCLDPDYPGMQIISSLDVDGYLTNSEVTSQQLSVSPGAPTAVVPLAADAHRMAPALGPAGEPAPRARKVVYVGAAGALAFKGLLPQFLREAAAAVASAPGWVLEIWGGGWGAHPEFAPWWRGVLPQEELGPLYGSAAAVLGVTMDGQRAAGMANNRVFEALAAGAALVTDWFPALERLLLH